MSSPGTNPNPELPAVDERLVAPDCGYEIDDGKLVPVPPALEPHADRHAKLAALLEAHAAADFNVALDMLEPPGSMTLPPTRACIDLRAIRTPAAVGSRSWRSRS